jgi:hypothetical protein
MFWYSCGHLFPHRRTVVSDFEKVRENRLRRQARRRGWELLKSRVRDPRARDFGTWLVVDIDSNSLVTKCDDTDEVEAVLND